MQRAWRWTSWLGASAFVVLVGAETSKAEPQPDQSEGFCVRGSDCHGYGNCVAGSCGHCTDDMDCGRHGRCKSGTCNHCDRDSDCLTGTCSAGTCGACSSTAECKGNGTCAGGRCGHCSVTSDCPAHSGICLDGRCSRYAP